MKLLFHERVEVAPPWVEYPAFSPGDFFWREAGEQWLTQVWEPYWKSLSAPQLDEYLQRWRVPDPWRMLYFDVHFANGSILRMTIRSNAAGSEAHFASSTPSA